MALAWQSPVYLERKRLLDLLPEEPGFAVWLEAPAGFGKSVLAGQLAARLGLRTLWASALLGEPRDLLAQALGLPREAEGVHAWALGVYRRHFRRIYGALALAGAGLLLPEGLGTVLFALGLGLALWWLLFFPHDMVHLRGGGGRYNPLDPEFRKLWEEARG